MTRYFQITSLPPGEAPIDIQTAWIGCVMPLYAMTGERRVGSPRRGVLSRKILPNSPGYTVRVLEALAVLERRSPAAARWWRENTPYLVRPGKLFVFDVEACRLCDASASVAVALVTAPVVVPGLRIGPMFEPAFPIGSGSNIFVRARPIGFGTAGGCPSLSGHGKQSY
jgi:hypothetical protein